MLTTGKIGGWVAGFLLLQCQAAPAPTAWIRLSAPNLELLTNGDVRLATAAIAELADLRSDWQAATPPGMDEANPRAVRIVAFASETEYRPFRVNAFSPAYFVGGLGQDTIVLGRLTKQSLPALRHEFVHHLIRARWQKLPLWLEEGLADYFGGIEPGAAQLRAERLRRDGMLPLDELASMTRSSAGYQNREAALQFYAQSWALAHLLITDSEYRAHVWACVDRLNHGETLENTAQGLYGHDVRQLQADLTAHLAHLKTKPSVIRPAALEAEASLVDVDEMGLALARLLLRKGDTAGAQGYLDQLLDSSRANPELWSLTGDLALKQGRPLDARFALQEALRLGSRDARGLKQLAVLEQNALNRTALEPILARLVDVDPGDDEARRALSSLQAPR